MSYELQKDILLRLQKSGVPFVLVGGHAVVHHGHVRATEDVDVVWLRSPPAEAALAEALQGIAAVWITDEIDPVTHLERVLPVSGAYISANHLMMLHTDRGFLDLFDYVPGCPDADVGQFFAESIVGADGLRYPSLPWLRRMKQAAGRPKDRIDLEELDKFNE